MSLNKKIDDLIRALQALKTGGGLGTPIDPRDFTDESNPNAPPGNLLQPVLDESGCVVDPRVNKDDCPTFDFLRNRGFIPPWSPKPGSKPWVATTVTGDIEVPTGGYTSSTGAELLSIQIPDGYVGKMMGFGYTIEQHATNFASITIKMMISDQAEPLISLNPFYEATFQHPIPCYLEIPPGKTLTIQGFNTGVAGLDVGAIAFGFVEPAFS